jgi:hypothetical protein
MLLKFLSNKRFNIALILNVRKAETKRSESDDARVRKRSFARVEARKIARAASSFSVSACPAAEQGAHQDKTEGQERGGEGIGKRGSSDLGDLIQKIGRDDQGQA